MGFPWTHQKYLVQSVGWAMNWTLLSVQVMFREDSSFSVEGVTRDKGVVEAEEEPEPMVEPMVAGLGVVEADEEPEPMVEPMVAGLGVVEEEDGGGHQVTRGLGVVVSSDGSGISTW